MSSSVPLRRVGTSGLLVSAVGLGCNNFGRPGTKTETIEGTRAVIDAAVDAGVTFLDTADMYGGEPGLSESLMSEALRGRRDEVIIATKFGHFGRDMGYPPAGAKASRSYIRRAVEGSLSRLQTDHIDLYQLHTPDPHTPIEETLDVLTDLVREGKVRYLGHSNLAGWQIAEADFIAATSHRVPFVSAQNHYSLLARAAEREVLPAVRRFGLGFLPYFPLHNGLLTGKFTRSHAPEDTRISRQRSRWPTRRATSPTRCSKASATRSTAPTRPTPSARWSPIPISPRKRVNATALNRPSSSTSSEPSESPRLRFALRSISASFSVPTGDRDLECS